MLRPGDPILVDVTTQNPAPLRTAGRRPAPVVVRYCAMLSLVGILTLAACRAANDDQDLVIAATGEPTTLLPPLVADAAGRDVSDLIYEPLASLRVGGSPYDSTALEPGLAASWRRIDSVTWRFSLRPNAEWHDGTPVTADDVVFSFAAYTDTTLGAPGITLADAQVSAEGDREVLVRFPRPAPDQLYDAATLIRVLPRHLWDSLPRGSWAADSSRRRLVGSGTYRLADWRRGQSLILERVRGTGFRRIAWRFAADQEAALNLTLSGEADVLETVTSPSARQRARADSTLQLVSYPSAVYGFLGFRLADPAGRPDPILANRAIRQALTHAIDRRALVTAVIGEDAEVPPGPLSRAAWIWNDSIRTLGYDVERAGKLFDEAGWPRGADGIRRRSGRPLTIDILVPSTSPARRQLGEGIQQMWRQAGVTATITAVDFPIFQERLATGRFETMIGAWLDEPKPTGLVDQWTAAGIGRLNHGRYQSAAFDGLVSRALAASSPEASRALWREAMDTLNVDAPAVFLYTPTNQMVASARLGGIVIDPYSWLHRVTAWQKTP